MNAPAPCTCGDRAEHIIARRRTADGHDLHLHAGGALTGAVGYALPGVPVARPRTLDALRPASRLLLAAARASEQVAANDNAGAAWHERDTARAADGCHMGTVVPMRDARLVLPEVCRELDPGAWRLWSSILDGRAAVAFHPVADRSPATERQERVLRALVRAAGLTCA